MLEYNYDSKLYPGELEYATELETYSVSVIASNPQIVVKPEYLGSLASIWSPKPYKWHPVRVQLTSCCVDRACDLMAIWDIQNPNSPNNIMGRNSYGGPRKKEFNLKLKTDIGTNVFHLCGTLITSMKDCDITLAADNILTTW